jgi:NADPH:quinone reductase-like Zn-dependent oxidoreductase
MKAIVIDDYGGVDRLHLRELPDPRPQADEVLVRVRAAGVNPVDWKIRHGQLRFILHVNFPFIPGGDIAGEVVSTGPQATEFKAGDAVVGFVELKRGGGYAELAVAKKTAVALKASSLSFT